MYQDLQGKVAVVTGAGRGIGRGIAQRLAREGCRLVINDIDEDALASVAAAVRELGAQALPIRADVGSSREVEDMFVRAASWGGGIDVLVNNAGWSVPVAHLLEMTEQHWDDVLRTNLKSMFLCTQAAARCMVEAECRGSIVCLSSFGAPRAHRAMAAYDASKGGVEAFTRAAAVDLAPFGVRVNAIGPGAIHTEFFDPDGAKGQQERARPVPLGRVGDVHDIANGAAFLASSQASYITGQVVYIDGGVLAQLRPAEMDRPLPPSLAGLRRAADAVSRNE